jgi:hypothetical protein
MPSALDLFRAQQQAAEAVYVQLLAVAALLADLRKEADALQRTDELKQLLERQQRWLVEAQQTVSHVELARQNDMHRFWRGVVLRWVIAAVFAITAAAAAGAAYVAFTRPYDRELEQLRGQAAFGQFVEQRALSMSAAERRQFDALMRWPHAEGSKSQSGPQR